MSAKVQKLEDQFRSDAAMQLQKDGTSSSIFSGVAIYVNGYTGNVCFCNSFEVLCEDGFD